MTPSATNLRSGVETGLSHTLPCTRLRPSTALVRDIYRKQPSAPLVIRFRPERYRKIKVYVPTMTRPRCRDHVTPAVWRLIKGKRDAVTRKPCEILGNSDLHRQENDGKAAATVVRASHRNV
jgi:hypothetical protein